jgi:predicted transcriptional regulator
MMNSPQPSPDRIHGVASCVRSAARHHLRVFSAPYDAKSRRSGSIIRTSPANDDGRIANWSMRSKARGTGRRY